MKHTLTFSGDPGLFGPDSQTWRIMSDVSVYMGGLRALFLQAAHPEVVSGVYHHSNYKKDPLGRLSRTADYLVATCFGAMPEVEKMIAQVKKVHEDVTGISSRRRAYAATQRPDLSSWVHNSLVGSFLVTYQLYGDAPLTNEAATAFIKEQTILGKRMGANQLPETPAELSSWLADHPDVAQCMENIEVISFLSSPKVPISAVGYSLLRDAAIGSLPIQIMDVLSLRKPILSHLKGSFCVGLMRKFMGFSPVLQLAYRRINQSPPSNR